MIMLIVGTDGPQVKLNVRNNPPKCIAIPYNENYFPWLEMELPTLGTSSKYQVINVFKL